MKSSLTYRDKVILLVIIVIAIFLVGIFAFIRPTSEKIATNKATLESVQAEQERIEGVIAEIPTIEANIKTEYDNAKALATGFAEHRETYQAEQFIQEYFNTNNIMVDTMTVTPSETETIEFYYYTPNVITYPLYEAADINGNLATATAEKLMASTTFSNVETQEVETYSISIAFTAKKDNIKALLDAIKDIQENVLVTSLNITDYSFGAEATDPTLAGYSTGDMTVKFYVLEPLAEPVLD